MNERLKELAEQAGATVMERSGWTDFGTLDLDVEKFGELILEDVMSICEALGDKGMDGHYCVDAIRNKFGLWPVVLDSEENAHDLP